MAQYSNIVVAIDYSPATKAILERVRSLASGPATVITLLHVVEYLPPLLIAEEPFPTEMWMVDEDKLIERASKTMQQLTGQLAGYVVNGVVVAGVAREEICELAQAKHADLIIAGSHGRHGMRRLLGSTATALVHHAPCDVLLVRITD